MGHEFAGDPHFAPDGILWERLYPTAVDLLRRALEEPDSANRRLKDMAAALSKAYPGGTPSDDLREVQGALASAVTEFLRWRNVTNLSRVPDEPELAFHLIRIAYNRWQRRSRSDRKLRRATELGQIPVGDGENVLLSNLPDKNPPERQELVRQIGDAVDQALEGFSDRDRKIVRSRFVEKETLVTIAEQLGCHRATVSRVIARFLDRLRTMLAEESL